MHARGGDRPAYRVVHLAGLDGVDLLRSVSLTRIDAAGRRERVLESPDDLAGVLQGVFGLDPTGMPRDQLAAVWRQQADRYAAYQAKKTARA